jgi:hypothetical protein
MMDDEALNNKWKFSINLWPMSVAENEDFQGLETIQNLKKAFIP